jgi:hypothetical protein
MSTTFAIIKENREGEKIRYDIAHRRSIGGGKVGIKWFNINSILDAVKILEGVADKRDIKVHAMDNTAQGVKNIGDLIKLDKYGRLDNVNK